MGLTCLDGNQTHTDYMGFTLGEICDLGSVGSYYSFMCSLYMPKKKKRKKKYVMGFNQLHKGVVCVLLTRKKNIITL